MKKLFYFLAVFSFLTACANEVEEAAAKPELAISEAPAPMADDSSPLPKGVAGSYLAGRAAYLSSDVKDALPYLQETLAGDPDNTALLDRAILLLAGAGRIKEALPVADHLAELKPNAAMAILPRLAEAAANKEWDKVKKLLEPLPLESLNLLSKPLAGAWAAAAKGDKAEALSKLEPLAKSDPSLNIALLHRALIADILNDAKMADGFYGQVLARFNNPPLRLVLLAGNFYARQGNTATAQRLYEEFNARGSDSARLDSLIAALKTGSKPTPLIGDAKAGMAEAFFELADALSGDRLAPAALFYSRLSLHLKKDHVFANLLAAEALDTMERYSEAAPLYESLQSHPVFGQLSRLGLARSLLRAGNMTAALQSLEETLRQSPKSAEALMVKGDILRQQKNYAEAAAAYSQAIAAVDKEEPRHWALYYARGVSFERAKNWPKAKADFEHALTLNTDQAYVLNYLGYSLVERGEDLEKAKLLLSRAVELEPSDGSIVDSLGWAYFKSGDFPQSLVYLQRALELRPFDPVIIDHVGDALWRVNKREDAKFKWLQALKFSPEDELKSQIEKKLQAGLPKILSKIDKPAPQGEAKAPAALTQ
ncbi:MAG: tetratricopeptide repeat protein [Dongiaceae bacterium]